MIVVYTSIDQLLFAIFHRDNYFQWPGYGAETVNTARFEERLDEFHRLAAQSCGWDDFGGDEYLPGLHTYARALDRTARLSGSAWQATAQGIVDVLRGRLYSEHYKKRHPDYTEQPITRPLFIIGLPRSGTTALQKMLAADPQHQGLEYWLGETPMPRPPRQAWPQLPEFRQCAARLALIARAAPSMMAVHEMVVDSADECRLLLLQSFANVTLQSNAWIPDYEDWLYEADFAPVYRRYRENLQLIGLGNAARWILKDPSHLWAPQTLLRTFPDAMIVQMHRDPRELIPSVSSLVHASRSLTEPLVDKRQIGRQQLRQWSRVLGNLTALRRERPDLYVHDVHMRDLQRDPLGTVESLYRAFNLPLTEASRDALARWIAVQPKINRTPHHYSAEEFGLSDGMIEEAFADYIAALPV